MSLQNEVSTNQGGKKIVRGSIDLTAIVNLDLDDKLTKVDSVTMQPTEAPSATHAHAIVSVSGTAVTFLGYEADYTPGTTAREYDYEAIGDTPR